jgi:hypothetical protein
MAQANDISVYKGETVTLNFTMTPVVDITGWSIVFTLKKNQTDAAALVTVNATITSGVNGTFAVKLTGGIGGQTFRRADTYQYDVQRTDAGFEAVLSIGAFAILQEVKSA